MQAASSTTLSQTRIPIPVAAVADFAQRWGIDRVSLFGSVLRDDFRPNSDVDVLIDFSPGVRHGVFDLMEMEEELQQIFDRRVDLLTRRSVELSSRPDARRQILDTAEAIYVRGR